MDISQLLVRCPDITTLIIGPDQKRITCHKALLGFKSEYFDAACFGTFTSSEVGEIQLEEENTEAVSVFVAWLYTGRIPLSCTVTPAALWVLGDKLRSPGFANEAMHFLFRDHAENWCRAVIAEYVYDNTTSGSKLRSFIKDLILNEGPLSKEAGVASVADRENWRALIRRGGDLLVDISLEGSFDKCFDIGDNIMAWHWRNHHKYLEPITTRPIEDFLEGKPREGTRRI
ncbi:hypothetical protein LAWI1_G007185 [Lachnellula willkommii]|uniref:BTB domain-containing protein n=1 Tax=Lachnellula willkommii TaxID=215461 RepID=A0A559M2Q4_9HELO|nr:hypothetical protein LAWI1_G007185 [Lachnellula willkommii]